MKNRKGFTLVEMVCVVAIIVFLSAVALKNVSEYTKHARDLDANVKAFSAKAQEQQVVVDGYLNFSRDYATAGTSNTSLHPNGPSANPQPPPPPAEVPTLPSATPSTEPSATPSTEPSTTPPTTPSAPSAGGPKVNATTTKSIVKPGNGVGSGVQSITDNADGSITVTLLYKDWNSGVVNIRKNPDGSYYVLQSNETNMYFIAEVFDNNYGSDYAGGFQLTTSQINKLESVYGLKLA